RADRRSDQQGDWIPGGPAPSRRPDERRPRPEASRVLPQLHGVRALPDPPVDGEPAVEGVTPMKKLVDYLAPVGFLVGVAAIFWPRLRAALAGGVLPYVVC